MKMNRTGLTITGALVSAVAASACCLGPLVLTVLGIGSAASALALERYRPYLIVLTLALLGVAFYATYSRRSQQCGPGEACEMPRAGRAGRWLLWLATFAILAAITFPYYSIYLF
ncbi:MAG: mercuric transporter MerT family protein [Acidobacteriota bacterium]